MDSIRMGSGIPSRPLEGTRTRRIGDSSMTSSHPRPLNIVKPEKKEPELSKSLPKLSTLSGSRSTSRVPQPSSRHPSISQPAARPSLNRQDQSWPSTSSVSSGRSSKPRGGSGSSTSTRSIDITTKPAPNVLRRKKSLSNGVVSPNNESPRTSSSSSRSRSRTSMDPAFGIHLDRSLTQSPAEIQVAEVAEVIELSRVGKSPVIYPELDRYRNVRRPSNSSETNLDIPFRLATHDLPPPTPASLLFSGTSGSPSTRFSESPGPGPYSRDTTPTSIASQSPCLISSARNNTKPRLISPSNTRPPVTRRRAGSFPNEVDVITADPLGLAAVRESLTSSSSNSTVRDNERTIQRNKSKKLPPPPPSPPPRKSSQKFDPTQTDPSPKTLRKPSRPLVTSPPLEKTAAPNPQSHLSPKTIIPPSRPSRDGTPDMQSQLFDPVPVIHSNLSTQSLPVERRGSESAIPSSLPKASGQLTEAHRTGSTSRLPISGETSRPRNLGVMEPKKTATGTELSRPSRAPSPHITSSFSRFAFFGRKKNDAAQTEKKEKEKKKAVRKGPVAGTGHEGYGRVGGARRRSSSIGNATRGTSGPQSSQETVSSNDPFFAERMNPVIIAGGEVVENRNTSAELSRTESNLSVAYQPKQSSDSLSSSLSASRNTLWPSPMSRTPHPAFGHRRPSDSSDSDSVTMKPTLAFRRSVQRLRSSPDNPLRLPMPINTSGATASPMTSFDTSVMSDESHFELQREVSQDPAPVHPAPKKLTKRSRSPRKWNIFSRSQTSQNNKKSEPVAATVKVIEKKPVPYYAMMDSSEQSDNEPMDVQEVLRQADVFNKSPSIGAIPEVTKAPEPTTSSIRPLHLEQLGKEVANRINHRRQLSLQQSATQPTTSATTAPVVASAVAPAVGLVANTETTGRRSRLPQVGRIPKVVSARSDHLSPKSFSRPFRASWQAPPRTVDVVDTESIAKGPSPPNPSTPVPDLIMEGSTIGSGTNVSPRESNQGLSPEPTIGEREFLAFSPRKNSDGTICTSSSSGSRKLSFAEATAVIPDPNDPPAEDEVWDEYNDLLGEENSKPPASASSSKGTPFHLETYGSKLAKGKALESPTIIFDHRKASTYSRATTGSSTYSADMTERIRAAFQPHPSPEPALQVIEEPASSHSRSTSLEIVRQVKVDESRRSSRSSRRSRKSDSSTASDEVSPLAQVNLRVGSMTVSKWLTFGHVLFSDVRHELVSAKGSLQRHSILVIDGLGNDDWSFYAAETYPAANFFNLSPRAPLATDSKSSSFPLSPPNHHQIQYTSHLDKFPFAPQSFTAVVFRFPVAAPESHYRSILTEARRVLKPGGYVELSILDVDLNNMGNRGRRAIRQLKERVNEKTPDTNLSSTADLIVRLLGKVGFSGIKAARVGVPAASSVTRSNSTRKSKDREQKKKEQPSLAEMMNDDSPLADEGITKMVSRVGRWWYTRCYENAAENPSGKSIWSDKALLAECEELGTSLKLMVCCARAPDRITSF